MTPPTIEELAATVARLETRVAFLEGQRLEVLDLLSTLNERTGSIERVHAIAMAHFAADDLAANPKTPTH